jgi:hypothetical protein
VRGDFPVLGAYCHRCGAVQALNKGATMSDRSPRQAMTKKSGKSLKEKRAAKKAKSNGQNDTEIAGLVKKR